mmetsp:Transcript_15032/g.27259  ORF Transcript_15032/g.27259 Transcript_15032/m.27259 type:complete len:104 (+) Transcript_15032:1018-1329(+)
MNSNTYEITSSMRMGWIGGTGIVYGRGSNNLEEKYLEDGEPVGDVFARFCGGSQRLRMVISCGIARREDRSPTEVMNMDPKGFIEQIYDCTHDQPFSFHRRSM